VFFRYSQDRQVRPVPESPLSAEAFASAVERLSANRGKVVVVKLGGSAMEDPAATEACLRSAATLFHLDIAVLLVHGGGKPIDRAMAEAGLTPKKVAGRRYTDEATLNLVVRVLKEISHRLAGLLRQFGCEAAVQSEQLHGEQLRLQGPDQQPIDLGRVGKVTRVKEQALNGVIGDGFLPVIPSLALDSQGKWLNVNADTAASAVAGALKADKAIFLTDTPGVLRDRANPASLIRSLSEREARELITAGVIDGGMVPKVEACFEALEAGATEALILDGRVPYSLLDVFLKDTFTGTAIAR
jgi:acetylglutamate kinase